MKETNVGVYKTPCTYEVLFEQEGILCSSITNYGAAGSAGNLEEGNTYEF